MTIKQKDRAEEYNRLIVEQGHVTRSMRYAAEWKPSEDVQQKIHDRASRMIELAEMLGYKEPEREVTDRIAAWMQLNPLALGKRRVKAIIDALPDRLDGTVSIQIGDPTKGGYFYQMHADECTDRAGLLHFTVPDSVAEHFRQQARRELQSELRALLNVSRA